LSHPTQSPSERPESPFLGGISRQGKAVTPLPVKRQHGANVGVLWRMGSHHPWFERFGRPCGRIYRIVLRPPLPEVLNGWRSTPGHLSLSIAEAVHKECLASASAPHGAAVLAAHREHWHINSCSFLLARQKKSQKKKIRFFRALYIHTHFQREVREPLGTCELFKRKNKKIYIFYLLYTLSFKKIVHKIIHNFPGNLSFPGLILSVENVNDNFPEQFI
jgi:hypothetical protein